MKKSFFAGRAKWGPETFDSRFVSFRVIVVQFVGEALEGVHGGIDVTKQGRPREGTVNHIPLVDFSVRIGSPRFRSNAHT